ncbi:3761_t:CDS:2, partial [Racocetra persica]
PPILDESAHNRLTQLVLNHHRMTKRDIQAALEQQEEKRRDWAEEHLHWAIKEWKNVLWSDEKYFCLIRPNLHQYIWRMLHEEFDDDCLVPAIKSKGVMMWGCFFWWGLGPLVHLHGSVTSASYRRTLSRYAISKLQDQYPN